MGQTLSEPETTKHTSYGEDDRLVFGVSEMQGWRLSMEDAHATILNLDNQDESAQAQCGKGKKGKNSFFAVYDGHGGSTVARYSGDTVHQRLRALDQYKNKNWEDGMRRAFLKTDEDLRANPDYAHDTSGCTAVAALITEENNIIVANAGDSRSVLSVGGEAKPLSYDHKPGNKTENSRIVAAGGFVEFGRVNGNLALSRAIGDFEFKQNHNLPAEQQIVTADPDIIVHQSTEEDEFLIIACDGIWDVLKNQETIDFVRRSIANRKELHEICELMMDKCIAPDSDWGGVGCDNMTVLLVALLNGKTKEDWYDWVADRVDKGVGYPTPKELPDPFANRQPTRGGPGGFMGGGGGPLSNPAQLLSNAISNGTLRFDQSGNVHDDSGDMDEGDDADQYHKSPTQMDDDAMIEDTAGSSSSSSTSGSAGTTSTSSSSSSAAAPPILQSSATPSKLAPGPESPFSQDGPSSALSPPSAVVGVHSNSPSSKSGSLPNSSESS